MVFRKIDTSTKSDAHVLLRNHWRPSAIANRASVHQVTVYRWEKRIQKYGQVELPRQSPKGPLPKLHPAALKTLLEYQRRHPSAFQAELCRWLEEEWQIELSRSGLSEILKKEGITRKKGQRLGPQSPILRTAWQADMGNYLAYQLVFVDESLFKAQSGWRLMAYGPVGEPVRYHADINRGETWSVLPAYTTNGYLPCTTIKKGYFKGDEFYDWVVDELLPYCNAFPAANSVICLDNAGQHIGVSDRIKEAVEAKGCILKWLPPYSPDFSPIELTFSVLKAWIRRHFWELRPQFEHDFGGFLKFAVENSGCDRFAVEHFRHSAAGYRFEGDYEALLRELQHYEDGELEIDDEDEA